jgi:hypothetical protein
MNETIAVCGLYLGRVAERCGKPDCPNCRKYESDPEARKVFERMRPAILPGDKPKVEVKVNVMPPKKKGGGPADLPCVLGERDGVPGWCGRHQEFHEEGTAGAEWSQDPGQRGVRFRQMRDMALRKRGGKPVDAPAPSPTPSAPEAPLMPGTATKRLLASRGVTTSPGCSCNGIMREMDAAGVQGCRDRVEEFAAKMRRNATFMSFQKRLAATMNVAVLPAVKSLWLRVTGRPASEERPFYSFASLILEACDVAEESQRQTEARRQEREQAAQNPPEAQASNEPNGADGKLALVEAAQRVSFSAPPRPHLAPLRWAVGLTTVPGRRRDLLPKTLKSLEKAGFSEEYSPRLFVDGDAGPWPEFPNEATFRFPAFSRRAAGGHPCPWSSWWLGMQELFLSCPDCDRYAMFQDDLVAVRNLRAYLEACPFPERAYLNLFTFMNNELPARPNAGPPGWFEAVLLPPPSSLAGNSALVQQWRAQNNHGQCGRGALGLVFDREGLVELLRFKDAVERPLEHPALRGLARIDGGVVDSMNKLGRREWVHRPSLVQHTGELSAVSRRPNPETKQLEPKRWRVEALTFPGEDFDALSWLPAPEEVKQQ